MARRWFLLVPIVAGLASVVHGCSSEQEPADEAGKVRKVRVKEGTSVIEAIDDVIVEPSRLTFPAAKYGDVAAKKAGDLLVGDRSKKPGTRNPDGFLRRVVSVSKEGGQLVVLTEQASVLDVIDEAKIDATVALVRPPEVGINGAPTLGPGFELRSDEVIEGPAISLPELDKKIDFVNIENKPLSLKLGGKSVPLSYTVKVSGGAKGSISFSPRLEVGFDIDGGGLKAFHSIFRGEAKASMDYYFSGEAYIKEGTKKIDVLIPEKSALFDLMTTASKDELNGYLAALKSASEGSVLSWKLFDQNFILGTLFIGPVPVPMSLNVNLEAVCSPKVFASAEVKVGASVTAQIGVGARYSNQNGEDQWSPVFDHSGSVTPLSSSISGKVGAELECSLKPSLGLIFYGLAGPTVWVSGGYKIEGGVKVECDPVKQIPAASAYLDGNLVFKGGVGAKLGVFLPGYSFTLKETSLTLATWNVEGVGKLGLSKGLGELPFPGLCIDDTIGSGGSGGAGGGAGGSAGSGAGNQGGGASCTPKTCAQLGAACGSIGDGCGKTLSCGSCGASQTCQGNQCVGGAPGCKLEWDACAVPADCCAGMECKKDPADNTLACQKIAASSDPCASAPSGGAYCGESLTGGTAGSLYTCSGGVTTNKTACASGCQVNPPGTADACKASSDPCASAPSGGDYCGSSLTGGTANKLYTCSGGVTTASKACAQGCTSCPPGTPDVCAPNACGGGCATMTCGGICCPAGTVTCGSGGQCCDGVTCKAGCPC